MSSLIRLVSGEVFSRWVWAHTPCFKAILEWLMGLAAAIYISTYWYDLRHILRAQPPKADLVGEP
jgi:hypothetical protein